MNKTKDLKILTGRSTTGGAAPSEGEGCGIIAHRPLHFDAPDRVDGIPDCIWAETVESMRRLVKFLNDPKVVAEVQRQYRESRIGDTGGFDWFFAPVAEKDDAPIS